MATTVATHRRPEEPCSRGLETFACAIPFWRTDHAGKWQGCKVTIARDDGRRESYRIVGEDETEPSQGTLSYVSPVARALMGRQVGDVVRMGISEVEILEIKPSR